MFAGDWADFCKSGHTELRVNMCAQITELGKMVT